MSNHLSGKDPVQTVLDRLEGVKQTADGQYMARCPAHDDHRASLSVGRGDDGRALVHCKAGCPTLKVLRAIGLRLGDLYARPPAGRPQTEGKAKSRIAATYDYRDEAGALVFQVVRFDPKDFRQRRPNGKGAWAWKLGDVPRVLYRLPELLAADASAWTFVTEGEKDADNLAALGLVATTNPGGAGKWGRLTDDSALNGRRVVIIADRDAPGLAHAQDVAGRLHAKAAVVKVIPLPDMPANDDGKPRKDVSDWIEWLDGRTAEELAAALVDMAEAAPAWTPETEAGASATVGGPVLVSLADVEAKPIRWLWPSRIAIGKLTLIAGDPGLGKSFLTLDMAARVSRGDGWPDFPTSRAAPGGVVLLSAEDDLEDTIRPRLDAAAADVSRIRALVAVKRFDFEAGGERRHPFNLAKDLAALEEAIVETGDCRLVVIDPISAYLGATDSHKNAEIRGLLAPLSEIASRHGVALVAVTHLRKGEGPAMYRAMGSLAFVAAARAAFAVTKDPQDPASKRRLVLPVKNNVGNDKTGLAFRLSAPGGGVPSVSWEREPVAVSADEALARGSRAGDDDARTERAEATAWLREALAGGPVEAKTIYAQARQDGISKRTLRRAKRDLGAPAYREGFGASGSWRWKLPKRPEEGEEGEVIDGHDPDGEGPTPSAVATFGDTGNLWEETHENADPGTAQEAPTFKGCQALECGNVCPNEQADFAGPSGPPSPATPGEAVTGMDTVTS